MPPAAEPAIATGSARARWMCQLGGWGVIAVINYFSFKASGARLARTLVEVTLSTLLGLGSRTTFDLSAPGQATARVHRERQP